MKYTYQDVKEMVEKEGYELLSDEEEIVDNKGFVKTSTRIVVNCPNEKHGSYEVIFGNFKGNKSKKGTRCNKCMCEKHAESQMLADDEIKENIENEGYKLISIKRESHYIYVNIICSHGHSFKIRLDAFKSGQRCKKCSSKRLSEEQRHDYGYVKEFIESFGYKLTSTDYINSRQILEMICPSGHKVKMRWNSFQQGQRCSECNENISIGEIIIRKWLDKNNVKYIHDKPYFKDLKGNNKILRPDFILPDYKIWIEFDGIQHYKYGHFYNNLLDLMNIKYRDELKNKYAKDHRWKLIRIPYWDFDKIEKILELELK